MPKLDEIIEDLNVSIVDLETFKTTIPDVLQAHVARTIGQLKAARGNMLVVAQALPKLEASNGSR